MPEHFVDGQWWKRGKDRVHQDLVALVQYLRDTPEEKARMREALDHARLYGNRHFVGFMPRQYGRSDVEQSKRRLTANVCKAVVDAATAKIAKNRPRAVLMANASDWFEKQAARKATRAIEGGFQQAELYDLGPRVFKDAGIFGTGCAKWFDEGERVRAERVLCIELLVDPTDGLYGKPRSLYQTKWVDKQVLLEMYGRHGVGASKAAKAIEEAATKSVIGGSAVLAPGRVNVAEPVLVIEAWHLPSGPDAKDGKHAIVIDGCTLRFEDWERDDFPFTFYRWSERVLGFWGQGLVEEVRSIQLEVNKTLDRISKCLHLMAVPRIFVETTAAAVKSMITNEVGAIIPYKGSSPPVFATPPAVPPELFAHLRWLISQAFEMPGISQLSAQSKKPAGLDSGKALREFNDIESERFAIPGRSYETWFMRGARQMISIGSALEKNGKGWKVVHVDGRRRASELRWRDIKLADDGYTMQVMPTSALPRDMAGRMAAVEEMIAAGFIDQKRGKQLLEFPDIDGYNDLDLAPMELVEQQVARMLDPDVELDDAYSPPEPYSDLQYAVVFTQLAYCRERLEGAPEERLELLQEYIDAAARLIAPAAASAQGAPGASVTPITSAAPSGVAPASPAIERAAA